jgi:hypothetical protein
MQGPRFLILALITAFLLPIPSMAATATLTLLFTNHGQPLRDPTLGKYYLYEPGQRENYITWGHSDKPARIEEGIYDLVVVYENDTIREERVVEELAILGEMEREVAFDIPVARLTVNVTSGGKPLPRGTGRYSVHRAGQRGKPLAARRPGVPVVLRPGSYDVEVAYRDLEGLQSRWLERLYVENEVEETVEISSTAARLEITVISGGRALPPGAARWRAYRAGARETALVEADSGEGVVLAAGRYDVGVFYDYQGSRGQRWISDIDLRGNVRRQIDIASVTTNLRVNIRRRGAWLTGAWFGVFPAGDRRNLLVSARNGSEVQLEPGDYDIRCKVLQGGVRAEQWISGRSIDGNTELSVEMEYPTASIRLQPQGRRETRDPGRRPRVLLLVDSSAEMAGDLGVYSRMSHVSLAVAEAMESLRGSPVDLGMRVYGILPRSARNCTDTTLLVPPGPPDPRAVSRALKMLRPSGYAPIAHSLQALHDDLETGGDNVVVLIAGGPDDCEGDSCAAAADLLRSGDASRIHVLALGAGFEEWDDLACIGALHAVESAVELKTALREIFRDVQRGEAGTVNLFEPGGGKWIAGGYLRERVEVSPGRYDVQIRTDGEAWVWEDVEITGAVEAEASRKPPRRLR